MQSTWVVVASFPSALVVCDRPKASLARTRARLPADLLKLLILRRPRLLAGPQTDDHLQLYAEGIFVLHLFLVHLSLGAPLLLAQAQASNLKSRRAKFARPVMVLESDHLAPCLAPDQFSLLSVTAALHLPAPHSDPRGRWAHDCGCGFVVFLARLRLLQQHLLVLVPLQWST